ncbi:hypothetical protein ACIBK8_25540 [Streptomyces sp. NPDC050161]|uniref:hypothetical protein n=1 Tax=Streptomyces sp. NPDC050161 TaxID=3365604 RepID=UPI0037AB3052
MLPGGFLGLYREDEDAVQDRPLPGPPAEPDGVRLYWIVEGGGIDGGWRRPRFSTQGESPDGHKDTNLRHHWATDGDDGEWLRVIGPDADSAIAAYHRLWEERFRN